MASDAGSKRDLLRVLAALPLIAIAARASQASAQASPVKVDTQGLVAKIKFEAPIAGFLSDINGKYKLRVTELTLAPGGHVGEHNHVGPGIRQVTAGEMTYVLPDKTVVYGAGDYFFEAGDVNHTVCNKTDAPMVHVLFEILPAELSGPSLIPVKHHWAERGSSNGGRTLERARPRLRPPYGCVIRAPRPGRRAAVRTVPGSGQPQG
jgi:quercetin dioxygenase-like cupin family protein